LGVADTLADDLLPVHDYHWFGADGEPVMTLEGTVPAASGWDPDYLFHQPALEEALEARVRELANVSVERGVTVEGIALRADRAELRLPGRSVTARWVIGADGANSLIRESLGIPREDLGFQEQWFVVDVAPDDMAAIDLPPACQWCDPSRPTTHIQSGRR